MKEAYDEKQLCKHLKALEEAIQTMRRTDCYGYAGNKPDFEWPTPNDLLQMSKNIAIKIQALKYKICS